MATPDAKHLAQTFHINHWVIKQQLDGINHADSLLQLPFRGNCLNWVVGHILTGRCAVLAILGEPPVMTAEEMALYETGSAPITSTSESVALDKLAAALDESQQLILSALRNTPQERLEYVLEESEEGQSRVGDEIEGLAWHETYHVGQLELLRQLAGKNDQVI